MDLSDEQMKVIDEPGRAVVVRACAGSGKTLTAVHRLYSIRRHLGNARGRVALLSFSNVAVETFRRQFTDLCTRASDILYPGRVDIDTVDGFITSNIIKPHAYRTMASTDYPFLITGGEPFLAAFTMRGNAPSRQPICASKINVKFVSGRFSFSVDVFGKHVETDQVQSLKLITRLGRLGAYTHEAGRYWCYETLIREPLLLKTLVARYPHILIDEAQDIGSAQQAILDLLCAAGCVISLIGDSKQSIYEYAGADGSYLRNHASRFGAKELELSVNFRSRPAITKIASTIGGKAIGNYRQESAAPQGAYFRSYVIGEERALAADFEEAVLKCGLRVENSAVLCRATRLVEQIDGAGEPIGQGVVAAFAKASAMRDQTGDYFSTFKQIARAIESLLVDPPKGFATKISDVSRDSEFVIARRLIWEFVRDVKLGLPVSSLQANTQWHAALKSRIPKLLLAVGTAVGANPSSNLGQRLSVRGLPAAPVAVRSIGSPFRIRVCTVHGAKGESLDAAMYVATKANISAFLEGPTSEAGRIGYVAVTRPMDLLWLGVPQSCYAQFAPALLNLGFQPAPQQGIVS